MPAMDRKFLRGFEGLSEEQVTEILNRHHSALGDIETERDTLITERDTANAQIDNLNSQIEELSDKVAKGEDTQKEFEAIKAERDNYKTQIAEAKKESAIKLAIAQTSAVKPEQVYQLLDKEGLELNEKGEVKGLDKALKDFEADNAHFFQAVAPKKEGIKPVDKATGSDELTKEQFNAMSYDEKAALYTRDAELFQKLSE